MIIRNFSYMARLGAEYLSWEIRGTNFGSEAPRARLSTPDTLSIQGGREIPPNKENRSPYQG